MLIEIDTFRLADGADEEAFLAADKRVQQAFAPFQTGFVRRTTARAEDGSWAVITLWGGAAYADEAVTASADDDSCRALAALVDDLSRQVRRYTDLDG